MVYTGIGHVFFVGWTGMLMLWYYVASGWLSPWASYSVALVVAAVLGYAIGRELNRDEDLHTLWWLPVQWFGFVAAPVFLVLGVIAEITT